MTEWLKVWFAKSTWNCFSFIAGSNPVLSKILNITRRIGIEPIQIVLETIILPLNYPLLIMY
jgi:hypothetical protein